MLNNLFPSNSFRSKNFIKSLQGVKLKSQYCVYDPWSRKISFGGICKINKDIDFFLNIKHGGYSPFHLNGRTLEEADHFYRAGNFFNPLTFTTGFKNEDTSYFLDFDVFLNSDNLFNSPPNRSRFRFREFKAEKSFLDDQNLKEDNLKEEKLENLVNRFDKYISDKESSQQAKIENFVEETGSSFEKLSKSNKSLTAF